MATKRTTKAAEAAREKPAEETKAAEAAREKPADDTAEQAAKEPPAAETKQTAKAKSEPPKAEKDPFADIPNPCVYCGPSVRNVARQYTTFQGGLTEELKNYIKAHPAARRLIVPVAKFAITRRRLETPGTAEAIIYKKLKAEL